MRSRNDHGAALITVLLMLTLISAMLVATTTLVVKDQRARFQDTNRTDTFYVAHAGLEKITNDLGRAFSLNYAPTQSELNGVMANPPTLGGMKFEIPGGGARSGYTIKKGIEGEPTTIQTGPFTGLRGMITPYTINVTAQSQQGSEVSMQRIVNTIAIPVFQFGIFSETDLSFFPGPDFNFGGRVHTNGNLFLAKDDNTNQLILGDYVTAFKDVIRHRMAHGRLTTTANYDGTVKIAKTSNGCSDWAAATCRQITLEEGSLNLDESHNTNWETISKTTYAGYIKNGANGQVRATGARATGANRLVLPITSGGEPAIELIRRPRANENNTNINLFEQRYYSLASLRILLSDRASDLDNLAGKGPGNAQDLQASWNRTAQSGPGLTSGTNLPWQRWPYTIANDLPLVSGWIKIEMQDKDGGDWTDVTTTILNLGYWGGSLNPATGTGSCAASATAIIRIQRFKDNPTNCTDRNNFWSNTLYDSREGAWRDNNPTTGNAASRIYLGGIMHYVELDIANLRTWLAAQRVGNSIMETTGYVVYFSDRRGDHNGENGPETGQYGFEDVVNQGGNDGGEDVNASGATDTWGGRTFESVTLASARAPFHRDALVTNNFETIDPGDPGPTHGLYPAEQVARASRPIFFRRALKLVNGNRANMLIDAPVTADRPRLGLTVVSENPVYIHGDYNATTSEGIPTTYTNEHVACAVIADAVTLLSNAWNDRNSFVNPENPGSRAGDTTTYRTAVISGKGLAFQWPDGLARDFGTDGGTHNFLRYLEAGTRTLNYRGSIVSLYYNHQATGTYKCCTNVYGAPTRAFAFDTDFLTPSLLPPRTPMFRTIDVTNFTRLSQPPEVTP